MQKNSPEDLLRTETEGGGEEQVPAPKFCPLSFFKKHIYLTIVLLLAIVSSAVICTLADCDYIIGGNIKKIVSTGPKVDDWVFSPEKVSQERFQSQSSAGVGSGMDSLMWGSAPASVQSESIGFAAGGAKDVNNFRKNIEKNYLPLPTDISYEGLFYDYYFDTGQSKQCEKLFCPSYSYAISADPFSGEKEYYMAVGLNSGMKESDFKRKKLNLVVVLDISGSMGSSFDSYYYDRIGREAPLSNEEDEGKSKMQIANEAVVGLLDHLKNNDRFGMVLYDDSAYLAKPVNLVEETDMESIKGHILEIIDSGGTNMEAGMKLGTEQFAELMEADKEEYENRIIFLTDAMPNTGATSKDGLVGIAGQNADNDIYSTFIGIGVDFNTELTEAITKIRGANYYSVHSSTEFKTRMDDEFEYMVTPLVFDLKLVLEADGYEIEKVYGSPEADEATGEIMKVNTLFPSKSKGGETRGGLVLLKLKKTSENASLKLKTSYSDRSGTEDGSTEEVMIRERNEYFANSGIRKGVVLSRYADLMKNWINDERAVLADSEPVIYAVDFEDGIIVPDPKRYQLGQWERKSAPLKVNAHYGNLFEEFKKYLNKEILSINDETIKKEISVLDDLILISEKNENAVCVKEGEYVDHFYKNSFECCTGLIKVSSLPVDDDCEAIIPKNSPGIEPGWACINCGDGKCGNNYENKCNCPQDCGAQSDKTQ